MLSLRKRNILLLVALFFTLLPRFGINVQSAKSDVVQPMGDSALANYKYVDLAYLASHLEEFKGVQVATAGTMRFYSSTHMFEDFWLQSRGNKSVPVVAGIFWFAPPREGALVKVSGTIEFSSIEGGFFYLNASSVTAEKNVILLGWDGVQRNHLFELIERGLMPNLVSFASGGKMVNVTVSDHATDTKAGWAQILTGYRWYRTGVFSNHYWFHSIPAGYTILERSENYFGQDELATAFITGKLKHMETVSGTGTTTGDYYSHEAIYGNLPSQVDVVSVGNEDHDRPADGVGPLVLQFLENNTNGQFFAFFHFSDPDALGHVYGENSVQYENGIEACDYWLGRILTELNALNMTQNTLIYLTSDHGFDEGGFNHWYAPYIFLATNDKNVIRNGDEVDVAPTVYYGLGLWNRSFSPALDGYPLQVSLPVEEEQHRRDTLADASPIMKPSVSIISDPICQMNSIVTFNASDSNLVAVFLLVDKSLKADGPWIWNRTGLVSAQGWYTISPTAMSVGWHTVTIFAFDEHGASNGLSESNLDFYLQAPPPLVLWAPHLPSPNSSSSSVSSPVSSPSPSSSPVPSQEPAVTPEPKQEVATESKQENYLSDEPTYIIVVVAVIIAIGIGAIAYTKHKRK